MNPVFGVILSFLLLSERSEAGPLRVVAALGLVALGIVIVNYTPKIMRREKTAL